jgi:hypothetical protein
LDDTNPEKECQEYIDNIKENLEYQIIKILVTLATNPSRPLMPQTILSSSTDSLWISSKRERLMPVS